MEKAVDESAPSRDISMVEGVSKESAFEKSDEPCTSKYSDDDASDNVALEKEVKVQKQTRLDRLRELKLRRNEARKLNHAEVVEEDRRNKLPTNWENRKKRAEWELAEMERRKACEADGEDYDRVKLLNISAADAEKMERNKKRKMNPDEGFSTYEEATARQNRKLTKMIQPNHEEYERQRRELGDETFYAGVNTILPGKIKDTPEGIQRMVDDLEKQREKSKKFHRRRFHNENKDVDYINERNSNFNKKADRFYGKYTTEIKQNLERGTAV